MMEGKEMSDYTKKISNALMAWKDCDKKRSFILLTAEEDPDSPNNEDSRIIGVGLAGTDTDLANLLVSAINHGKDFREALHLAVKKGMKMRKES